MVEVPGESREIRVQPPVPRKRDGRKTVLLPIVASLLWDFMANAGEITLATSGFEFRPTRRKAG